ncbi:MAG: GlsB/YeaQ/YmgE family stress response membrane protein [Rhodocyclaceae bacterium]|nr:GlsB/YeaQ/YmgE family stress response membrane protein [Rhodocyclaceae bacterium]MBK9626019.1 GlsB/YeaQ/YmgE family stress response membrane protein [Rhodocyclaceae bacterium]MBL0074740.1 GlsB/YeaQ/YmgE family stress response membrane protein [Rhodocyclaceae bacterium]MBP6109966.1 GlsB/YeaQ/YmgE family stress response membrane protein [Rhodocyclaceae bacterium]
MGVVWTIVLGFVIGVMAKFLHPGKENMGFIVTVLVGIAGSFLAGVIGQFLGWYQAGEGAGFIASVIVAVILLVIYGKFRTPPAAPPTPPAT